MKQLLTTLLLLSFFHSQAQWSMDPAAPMVLCNAENAQSGLKVISDGSGGWYAFWSDARANASLSQLYGQHLDVHGNALWTANGMLIMDQPDSSIHENLPLLLPNGDILISYIYGTTGNQQQVLRNMRLAPDGSEVWAAPVELTRQSTGPLGNISIFYGINAFVSGNGVWLAWGYVAQGANASYAFERMDLDGTTHFGAPGHGTNGIGWGPFSFRDDLAGGFILDWGEGGSGGDLKAIRYAPTGTPVWTGPITVSTGTSGLATARATVSDSMGSYVSVFVPTGDLGMAQYDTSGAFIWTPPRYACTESHDQDKPSIVLENNNLFVAWADNRPPAFNQDMYMQKIDMAGNLLWPAGGVPVIQIGTYIPTPLVVAGDEGAVIATFDGNTGFVARRVLSDGSLDWPAPVPFCSAGFNPAYDRQVVLSDGMGGVTAFWQTLSTSHLYAAHIDKFGNPGDHIGISEIEGAAPLNIYPDPASDQVTISAGEAMRSIQVLGMDGRLLLSSVTGL
ncbi:MAG: hypothetical protein ABIQ75_05320, partial [Flavobacteriales bacterium]